jgi:hypothetical protein
VSCSSSATSSITCASAEVALVLLRTLARRLVDADRAIDALPAGAACYKGP